MNNLLIHHFITSPSRQKLTRARRCINLSHLLGYFAILAL